MGVARSVVRPGQDATGSASLTSGALLVRQRSGTPQVPAYADPKPFEGGWPPVDLPISPSPFPDANLNLDEAGGWVTLNAVIPNTNPAEQQFCVFPNSYDGTGGIIWNFESATFRTKIVLTVRFLKLLTVRAEQFEVRSGAQDGPVVATWDLAAGDEGGYYDRSIEYVVGLQEGLNSLAQLYLVCTTGDSGNANRAGVATYWYKIEPDYHAIHDGISVQGEAVYGGWLPPRIILDGNTPEIAGAFGTDAFTGRHVHWDGDGWNYINTSRPLIIQSPFFRLYSPESGTGIPENQGWSSLNAVVEIDYLGKFPVALHLQGNSGRMQLTGLTTAFWDNLRLYGGTLEMEAVPNGNGQVNWEIEPTAASTFANGRWIWRTQTSGGLVQCDDEFNPTEAHTLNEGEKMLLQMRFTAGNDTINVHYNGSPTPQHTLSIGGSDMRDKMLLNQYASTLNWRILRVGFMAMDTDRLILTKEQIEAGAFVVIPAVSTPMRIMLPYGSVSRGSTFPIFNGSFVDATLESQDDDDWYIGAAGVRRLDLPAGAGNRFTVTTFPNGKGLAVGG